MWKKDELIVLRINKDEEFIKTATEKASYFYKQCVLPQLLGNGTQNLLTESH